MVVLLVGGCAAGCAEEEIARYQVARTQSPAVESKRPQRLLGVIMPRADDTWFIKLVGPPEDVSGEAESFARFLSSLHFEDSDQMRWAIPKGWHEQPPSGTRYATFLLGPHDAHMELTVTRLGSEAAAVLPNVNRWRGQLGLPPVTEAELGGMVKDMTVAGVQATLVDFTAKEAVIAGPKSSGATTPITRGGERRPGATSDSPLPPPISFTTPDGWTKQPKGGPMRVAAFDVLDGDKRAEVTVIPLAGTGGSLLANVNRWRGQINLSAINENELGAAIQKIEVAGEDAHYMDMTGLESAGARRQQMLVVAAPRGEQTWFFKMTGPVELVGKQKAAFEEFVRSVRFE